MKIVSWNINGYRAVTGQNASKRFDKITKDNKLFQYIEKDNYPDIIALQEIKAEPEQIMEELRCPEGYFAYYNPSRGRKGYSGTLTLSKVEAKEVNLGIGIEKFDIEGRIIETVYNDLVHFNIYFPNGTSGDERLNYKMEFFAEFFNYVNRKYSQDSSVVISGDYNIAHKEIDLARPKENVNNSGFLPMERDFLDKVFNEMGFIDSFRFVNPHPEQYSWWSNRGRARENNVGWRIDYNAVTQGLKSSIKHAEIQMAVPGSDHCPVILEI